MDQIPDCIAVTVPDGQVKPVGRRFVALRRLPELDREVGSRLLVRLVVAVSGVDGDEAAATHLDQRDQTLSPQKEIAQ